MLTELPVSSIVVLQKTQQQLQPQLGEQIDLSTTTTTSKRQVGTQQGKKSVVASVISVNGSLRTAKMSTMKHVQKYYREQILTIQQQRQKHNEEEDDDDEHTKTTEIRKEEYRLCREMEDLLHMIQSWD